MSALKDKKALRAKAHADAVELLKQAQTPEIRTKVDSFLAEVETLTQDIKRIERCDEIAAELAANGTDPALPTNEQRQAAAVEYRTAWKDFMRCGSEDRPRSMVRGGAKAENMRMLNEAKSKMDRASVEQREQLAGTQSISYTEGTVGGYFVPAGFVYDVEKATKFYANLLDGTTVRIMETATGQILPYPTSNDTQQAWAILGEAQQIQQNNSGSSTLADNYTSVGVPPTNQAGDVLLGHVNFGAWKGSTGLIRVSLELLQDSAFSIEAFLTEAFAVRLGRGYEAYLTNGSGASQPFGILPAIAAANANFGRSPVVAIGSNASDASGNTGANSIGYQDLVNLQHSVDPTYRKGAKYMLHDQTVRFLKTLLDKFGRPLWVPGVKDGEPDTLCGFPYVINQSFPTIAPSATTVAFGSWQKFIVRKVKDLQVMRLDERFADFGEVAYVGFSRIDSQLVDAGTGPLQVLVQHS